MKGEVGGRKGGWGGGKRERRGIFGMQGDMEWAP